MFRRPRPDEIQEERPTFTKGERIGSAIAHAAPLLIGVPLMPLMIISLNSFGAAFMPGPIVAYIISRIFRHQQVARGAFQGMQAAIIQLILVFILFAGDILGGPTSAARSVAAVYAVGFLVFLYTLWGAWDIAWGYDFRYLFISNFVDRVTAANLRRQERRQQPRPPSPPDRIDR